MQVIATYNIKQFIKILFTIVSSQIQRQSFLPSNFPSSPLQLPPTLKMFNRLFKSLSA
jgi:hypothetical protein